MMNRLVTFGCLLLLVLATRTCAAAAEPPQVRHLRLNFKCELGDVPADAKTVDLWIPIPPSNERQTVKLLNASDLAAGQMTTEKTFGNRLYYRRFTAADLKQSPKVELVYDVEVHEAAVPAAKQLVSTRSDVPTAELAPYLRETSKIPIKGRITALAQGIKLPEGEPLRAGRAIYDHLVNTMIYDYKAPGAGQGDAVWACDSKTGDCTDFHSVFIGVCRWRGIPADHVFGLPLPPEVSEGDAKHCHCWAQFWVKDVGWVPIDASRANKFPKDRDYYFGTLGSTWVTLAHGRDVTLEPPQQGPPLNMLHGPVAEVDGKPYDGLRWVVHYKDQQQMAAK